MPDPVSPLNVDDLQSYRAHWDRVGPVLEKLHRRELRMMTEEQHLRALADVLELARPETAYHQICGLAEFYRRWRKP